MLFSDIHNVNEDIRLKKKKKKTRTIKKNSTLDQLPTSK